MLGAERSHQPRGLQRRLHVVVGLSVVPFKGGTSAVQGNMDPALLVAKPEAAIAETRRLLDEMRGRDGFIFNLGHGVPPDADIAAITKTVHDFT
jgi:uroporphyrinogen-III decarboxylase